MKDKTPKDPPEGKVRLTDVLDTVRRIETRYGWCDEAEQEIERVLNIRLKRRSCCSMCNTSYRNRGIQFSDVRFTPADETPEFISVAALDGATRNVTTRIDGVPGLIRELRRRFIPDAAPAVNRQYTVTFTVTDNQLRDHIRNGLATPAAVRRWLADDHIPGSSLRVTPVPDSDLAIAA